MRTGALLLLAVALLALPLHSRSDNGEARPTAPEAKLPIDVKADATEFKSKENIIIFSGSVVAVRGAMTRNSDRMEVYLLEGTREAKEIRATGNVSIKRDDVLATGKSALYLLKDDLVTLTGNPKIWRGTDMVEGETVIMHPGEERMEVKGRTRVLMNPETPKKAGEK